MIPRYQTAEMARIFSDDNRVRTWLAVELAAASASAEVGLIPAKHAQALREKLTGIDAKAILARALDLEETLKHDIIAFLSACEENLGEEAASLHYGLTSSDVVDTALACQLRDATDRLTARLDGCLEALRLRAQEHADTPMVGRSHGMHAEPTTFGIVLAGHYAEFTRQRRRLALAREDIAYGKLSGAVGTFAHLPEEVEARVLKTLGLSAEPLATQVVPRDRHAHLFTTIAGLGASIERFATNLRHWQRTEVGEVEEPFSAGQRGSSAMPHKRNPIGSENLCGLARLLRGYALAALEDVALWHERDISHSSVERVIAPDAFHLADFALARLTKIMRMMVVNTERMSANLELTHGLVASQTVLLELTKAGMPRQKAYGIVQKAAMLAWQEGTDFVDVVLEDSDVIAAVKTPALLREKARVQPATAARLLQRAFEA